MRVEHTTYKEAPPEVVWAVTEDVERWPEWTPTVTSVRREGGGPFGLGSVAWIKQPLQPESRWVVTEFQRGRRFAWETRRAGLRMTGTHEVSAEGTGTRNRLSVDAEGRLALLFWPVLRLAMKRALSDENDGLRVRCERTATHSSQPDAP